MIHKGHKGNRIRAIRGSAHRTPGMAIIRQIYVHELNELNKNEKNKICSTSALPHAGSRRRYGRIVPGIRAHKSAFFKQKRDKSLLSSICLSPPKASFQGDRQIDDNRIKFFFLLKKCTFICVCAKFVVSLYANLESRRK